MPDRLEEMLFEAGRDVEWPDTPDLTADVVERIAEERRPRSWLPRVVLVGAALSLVIAAVLIFSPGTRTAIADFLGIGGVRVSFGDRPEAVGTGLGLGVEVADISVAEEQAGFEVLVPGELGEPDEVRIDETTPAGPLVALVYGERPGLTPPPGRRAAVVFTQFRAPLAGDEFYFGKLVGGGTQVTKVRVGEVEGYWLQGEPHAFYYRASGRVVEERVRLVGNVLLWERAGFTLRLEVGDLSVARALEIAASVP